MPKLGQYKFLLQTPFFLYRDVEHARAGSEFGGTGFLISRPTKNYPDQYHHIYGVTNWHLAVRDQCSVVRLNTVEGKPDIFDLDPIEWHYIAGGHDVAVAPLRLDANLHLATALAENFFSTSEEEAKYEIGPGDDVFMIGRFIDYDGVETNVPSMRFGNISMLEAEVRQPTGYQGKSIVIDMHSRTGFSGSPVFVYRTTGSLFAPSGTFSSGHLMKLLGVHWGQFPEKWELERREKKKEEAASLVVEGEYVKGLSGMTLVCPAKAIQDVLDLPVLREMRARTEAALDEHFKKTGAPPISEGVSPPSKPGEA